MDTGGKLEIAALATRLDASPALLYRYFGSKDGLVAAVVEEFYDDYDAAVFLAATDEYLAAGDDWQTKEQARISREIAFLYAHPMARVVLAQVLQEPAAAHVDAARVAAQIEVAARNVERGQHQGAVAADVDPALAAAAFIGAFRQVVGEALRRPVPPAADTLTRMMIAIGAAIVPPPPAPTHRHRRPRRGEP